MPASAWPERIWLDLQAVRSRRPLVLNITNQVAVNPVANGLLALGASPLMTNSSQELEELLDLAGALVLNIGTLDRVQADLMARAGRLAVERSLPIILDPVGAGASKLRTQTALELLESLAPSVLRGNSSEIMSLAGESGGTFGVDSAKASQEGAEAAAALTRCFGCRVCISGAKDLVTDGRGWVSVSNGHPLMASITGLGCTASGLIGAFAAVHGGTLVAAAGAMAVLGLSGQLAAVGCTGPGSLQVGIWDRLYALQEAEILEQACVEEMPPPASGSG